MSQIEKSNPVFDIESKKKMFRSTVAEEINKHSKESKPIINLRKKIFQQCLYDKKEKVIMVPKDTLNHFKSKDNKNTFVPRSISNSTMHVLPEGKWARMKINTFIEKVVDEKLEEKEKESIIKDIESRTSTELSWKIATPEEARYAYNYIHSCMRGNQSIVDFYYNNPHLFLVLVAYRGSKIVGRCVCLKHHVKPYVLPLRIYQSTEVRHTHTEWLGSLQVPLAIFGYKILPSMICFMKQIENGISWPTVCFRERYCGSTSRSMHQGEFFDSINYVNYTSLENFARPHASIYVDFVLGMPERMATRNSRITVAYHSYSEFFSENAVMLFGVFSNQEIKDWFSDTRNLENQVRYLKDLEQHQVVQEFYLNNGVVDEKTNITKQQFGEGSPESSTRGLQAGGDFSSFVAFVERVRAERAAEQAICQG